MQRRISFLMAIILLFTDFGSADACSGRAGSGEQGSRLD